MWRRLIQSVSATVPTTPSKTSKAPNTRHGVRTLTAEWNQPKWSINSPINICPKIGMMTV
jgi:hypothetical protein